MGRHDEEPGQGASTLPTIDANELFEGMTGGDDSRMLLDLETGETILVFASDDHETWGEEIDRLHQDPQRYREVEPIESRHQYDWMVDFASALHDAPDIARQLEVALDGRGAFGRFRNVLAGHPDLQEHWYAWRAERLLKHATGWLRSEGIDHPLSTPRELSSSTRRKSTPSADPEIGLIHVLLLGAPDGKTELLGGTVLRTITADSNKKAEQLLHRLVRHACILGGIDYRRSLVDGRDQVTVGDLCLSRHGLVIEVSVAVPRAVWDAFHA